MASFLDCYLPSKEEKKINSQIINGTTLRNKTIDDQVYLSSKFKFVLNIITEKLDQTRTFQIEQPQKNIYRITFLYDTIYPGLDILSKLQFNLKTNQISCSSTVLRNYLPLRIKEKEMKLFVNRYLIRINGILKNGSIRLNPLNGQITFSMSSFLSIYQFESFIYEPMKLVQILIEELLKNRYYIRMHIYKILYFANEIDENYAQNPQLSSYQIKSINSFSTATIKLVDKILPFVHLQFPFMYNDHAYSGVKNISPDIVRKMNQMIRMLKYNSKLLQQGTLKCISHLNNIKVDIKSSQTYSFSDDEKKDLMNILVPPFVKYPSGEPPNVYSQIEIKTQHMIKWQNIDQGGFGTIHKAHLQFIYKKDMQKFHPRMYYPFSRIIVKKEDYEYNSKSKLNHEKEILANLKHSNSPFLAKYFYSEQEGFSQSLLIEYCPQKSLANFRQKNKEFMTLNTKLIILKYIAQGIKFLKDHKICHLDIKPSNILFGNGLVKLIDFGEAYHPQVCQKSTFLLKIQDFRPGTSLPYAPPESFSQDLISFSDRLDVFSFGVLMFQFLYDTYPMQHSKYHYNRMKQSYTQKTYQELILMAPEKCQYVVFAIRIQTNLQIPHIPDCSLSGQIRKEETLYRMDHHYFAVLYQFGAAPQLLVIVKKCLQNNKFVEFLFPYFYVGLQFQHQYSQNSFDQNNTTYI